MLTFRWLFKKIRLMRKYYSDYLLWIMLVWIWFARKTGQHILSINVKTDSCYHVSKWWITYVCIVTWITLVSVSWGNAGLQWWERENTNINLGFRVMLGKNDFLIFNFHCHISHLTQRQRMLRLIWKVEVSEGHWSISNLCRKD